jgi:hypothetical protein
MPDADRRHGLRWNRATREYARRRTAEGRSKGEIIRCLKRDLARTVDRLIIAATNGSPAPA